MQVQIQKEKKHEGKRFAVVDMDMLSNVRDNNGYCLCKPDEQCPCNDFLQKSRCACSVYYPVVTTTEKGKACEKAIVEYILEFIGVSR